MSWEYTKQNHGVGWRANREDNQVNDDAKIIKLSLG